MKSIKDEARIQATASKVYEALTTQTGYRGWWNKAENVGQTVGSEAKLYFVKNGQPVYTFDIHMQGDKETVFFDV